MQKDKNNPSEETEILKSAEGEPEAVVTEDTAAATQTVAELNEDTAAETETLAKETEAAAEVVNEVEASETVSDITTDSVVADSAEETPEDGGESIGDRVKVLSPGRTVLKRFFRSKLSVIGLVTIIALFLFAFLGPVFSPWAANGGTVIDKSPELIREVISASPIRYEVNGVTYEALAVSVTIPDSVKLGGISSSHWLGTDPSGYDVLTRLMYGGRISLTVGFVVVIIETLIGVVLGGLAGYFGKWVDNLIMRIVDILSCIPSLPIMLILSVIFTNSGLGASIAKLYYMMIVLCLIGWTGTARLVRGQILSLREQEFMLAAKASGLSTFSKIFKHLMPNVIPQLIVSMTLGLGSVILMEATLGFLSVGAPPTAATWGNLINLANISTYRQYYPNLWIGAGVCITLAILAFNFVGDGLRDAFDPKMKR